MTKELEALGKLQDNAKEQEKLMAELTRSVLLNYLVPNVFSSGETVKTRIKITESQNIRKFEVLLDDKVLSSFDLPKQYTEKAIKMGILDTDSAIKYLLNKRKGDSNNE